MERKGKGESAGASKGGLRRGARGAHGDGHRGARGRGGAHRGLQQMNKIINSITEGRRAGSQVKSDCSKKGRRSKLCTVMIVMGGVGHDFQRLF